VTAVADVRSQPFSQRYPQFNRPELEAELKQHGIAYVFLGGLLGGRPQQPSLYDPDGRVNYERLRASAPVQAGLDRLCGALDRFAVAMLCAEEDPLVCHRGLMIAPALVERGLAPAHLRGDGSIETTLAMENRLMAETGIGLDLLDGLFSRMVSAEDRRQLLVQAYRAQARRKAFRIRAGQNLSESDQDGDGE
jgi:hypothetical protein